MNIIICGAGRVGYTIAKLLSEQDHSITVIDQSSEDIQKINEDLDVKSIVGKATFPTVLEKANAEEADMIIAVTRSDEINMLICQIAFSVFKISKKILKYLSASLFDKLSLSGNSGKNSGRKAHSLIILAFFLSSIVALLQDSAI